MAITGEIDLVSELYRTVLTAPIWRQIFTELNSPSGRNASVDFKIGEMAVKAIDKKEFGWPEDPFEAHRQCADVHFCQLGNEQIDHADIQGLKIQTDYDNEKDVILFQPPRIFHTARMVAGSFAIFFPEDAHRPSQPMTPSVLNLNRIKKLVVKVPLTAIINSST